MNAATIRLWFGQVTTGAGVMVLAPTFLALLAHQITLDQAIPALAAGVIGLLFPENPRLAQTVQAAATQAVAAAPAASANIDAVLTAYRQGINHGLTLAPTAEAPKVPA